MLCTSVLLNGSLFTNKIGEKNAPFSHLLPTTSTWSTLPYTISCDLANSSTFCLTRSTCVCVAKEPIRTPSTLGSPTLVVANRAEICLETSSTKFSGTIIRRTAVHFCPAFIVISLVVSLINKSNSTVPGTACLPRIVAFNESASKLNGILRSLN